ncbi:MAG: hypothetical protein V4608_14840 [Bacteroidota bacterium]
MKNKELFEKTVSILVKAYQDDTLIAGEPCACAVGNIIASNMNYKLIKTVGSIKWPLGVNNAKWYDVVCLDSDYLKAEEVSYVDIDIKSTGYSKNELWLIEKAFESSENVKQKSEIFYKLMNTVDCLREIHEANTSDVCIAKSLFVKETV